MSKVGFFRTLASRSPSVFPFYKLSTDSQTKLTAGTALGGLTLSATAALLNFGLGQITGDYTSTWELYLAAGTGGGILGAGLALSATPEYGLVKARLRYQEAEKKARALVGFSETAARCLERGVETGGSGVRACQIHDELGSVLEKTNEYVWQMKASRDKERTLRERCDPEFAAPAICGGLEEVEFTASRLRECVLRVEESPEYQAHREVWEREKEWERQKKKMKRVKKENRDLQARLEEMETQRWNWNSNSDPGLTQALQLAGKVARIYADTRNKRDSTK